MLILQDILAPGMNNQSFLITSKEVAHIQSQLTVLIQMERASRYKTDVQEMVVKFQPQERQFQKIVQMLN